jgi:hypothetical protein
MLGLAGFASTRTWGASRVALAAFVGIAVPLAAPAGCAEPDDPVRASVVAEFTLPRGVLDKARSVELRVREGEITCDDASGALALPGGEAGAKDVAKKTLAEDGCPDGVRFCGTLSIQKSAKPRVFDAKAMDGAAILASGCATATLDKDAVPVSIKMFRYVAPSVCGDDVVQPREQCEPPGGDVCDSTCLSKEVVLSVGAPGNNTTNGKSGDKTDAFFVWPQGTGDAGRFVAFFSDRAVGAAGGGIDVGLRVMNDSLGALTSPAALAAGSILLPSGAGFPPKPAPSQQSLAQAAMLGGKYYVVFQDDAGGTLDVRLRVLKSTFEADTAGDPFTVNGDGQGEAGAQSNPTIAAGNDKLFVAWQDQPSGTIVGRSVSTSLAVGNQNQISGANGSKTPQVAFSTKGWVVVWASATGIKMRAVDANGTPSGGEQTVNAGGGEAESPRVAALPDGRFAVTWSRNTDIFVQRYDGRGVAIAGDQDAPLNDVVTSGDQTQPAIAAMPAVGGSYAVAWRDARSGHIRARLLGGSAGFLVNNVSADTSEFQASRVDAHDRAAPAVVAGGKGPFLAIGWEDRSSQAPGIVVRRFPMPTQ